MNKLYFAANSINIYSEDLQYLQDSIGNEIVKILTAITGNTTTPVISAGFLCEISPTDNTKLKVYQNGITGAILTGDGIIATSTEDYDGISLATYSLGAINYVYAQYYVANATYKIKDDTIVYAKKAIDLNTYQYVYNRQIDLIQIVVYTQTQYESLSDAEKSHSIFLGSVVAQGPAQPLLSVDGTNRKYLSAAIPDNSIELIKLVSNFMLPQTMVDPSTFINDNYRLTATNLQDDLNRIRTVIKDIKSTPTWDQPITGFKASDPDIDHLHRSGLFSWGNNAVVYVGDSLIPTSTGAIVVTSTGISADYINQYAPYTSTGQGVIISTGKILYGEALRELTTSTGLLLTNPTIHTVGTYTGIQATDLDPEDFVTSTGDLYLATFQLAHFPVRHLHITCFDTNSSVYITLSEDVGMGGAYSINYNTGLITILHHIYTSGVVHTFYQWGEQRIDTIVYSTINGLLILIGTSVISSQIPQPPIIPINNYAIANIHFGILQDRVYQKDIIYHHIDIEPIRELREIKATAINQYDINGNFNSLFIEGVQRLNLVSLSTGMPLAIGSDYTVTSTGDYPYITIAATASIHTDIFTQTNDELYLSVFQQSVDYTLTVYLELVSASNIYDTTLTITVPRKNIVANEPILLNIYKGFVEGYHKIKISGSTTYSLYKIIIGKLDTYYGKDKLYIPTISSNKIDTQSLRMDWSTNHAYLVGDIIEHDLNLYKCTVNHTSNIFLTDYNLAHFWEKIGALSSTVDGITNQLNNVTAELNKIESVNLEQQLRLNYLEGRQYSNSVIQADTYMSEEMTFDYETSSNIVAEIMDDNDWYNNWKKVSQPNTSTFSTDISSSHAPSYKQGYLRPRKQPYMLEMIDEYNIDGTGLQYKCSMSRYDSINQCYWMISNAGANAIGCISKLSKNMQDGKVEEISKWYLPAMNTNARWMGIDITPSGTYIFITLNDVATDSTHPSAIFKIAINTDGTLGKSSAKSGETLLMSILVGSTWIGSTSVVAFSGTSVTISSGTITDTGLLRPNMGIWYGSIDMHIISITNSSDFRTNITGSSTPTIGYFDFDAYYVFNTSNQEIGDITYWSTDGTSEILSYVKTTGVAGANRTFSLFFIRSIDITGSGWPYILSIASVPTTIVMNSNILNIDTSNTHSLCRDSNYIWFYINDYTTDFRFIYRIDINNDIISNSMIKASGRFSTTRNVDNEIGASGSICIGAKGDLLEIISTASNGRFIARRALKNALWAENQVCSEIKVTDGGSTINEAICFDGNYVWYASNNNSLDGVRLYKRNLLTGAETYCTLTGSWTYLGGLCIGTVTGTDYFYMIGVISGPTYGSRAILRTAVEAALGSNLNMSSVGAAFTSYEDKIQYDITTDGTYLYIINDTDDAIDKWNMLATPTKVTNDYITLWAATGNWWGIAYNNNKFYILDTTSGLSLIYSINSLPVSGIASTKTAQLLHRYQDPSNVTATYQIAFNGNDLYSTHKTEMKLKAIKTLEDPDVMQLHTFIDVNNILFSSWVMTTTPITERYFKPEEFSDSRNAPDQFYCAVGYGDEGFSILHLDEFLAGKSSTGKDRYNVNDIRCWHFKRGSGVAGTTPIQTGFNLIGNQTATITSIIIEKDIIILGGADINFSIDGLILDLKSGKAIILNCANVGTYTGFYYIGTLSERNDARLYTGTSNPELQMNTSPTVRKIHARTFTKDDESDYSGINPVTFVTIGTDGGCDLLRIDWDSNGNRTPVKVWNNIFNNATFGRYGMFIAPSGKIFCTEYATTGAVYAVSRATSDGIPLLAWEINSDAGSPGSTNTQIGSNLLGGYGIDISPNSKCWKTSSGTWRHQLICAVNANGNGSAVIVDIENVNIERLETSITTQAVQSIDNFEDIIIQSFGDGSGNQYLYTLNFSKKRRFNSKDMLFDTNNAWINNWDNMQGYSLKSNTRPMFAIGYTGANGSGGYLYGNQVRYSKDFEILFVGTKLAGLQLFYNSQQNNAIYSSKDFSISQSSKIISNNNLLTSYGDI